MASKYAQHSRQDLIARIAHLESQLSSVVQGTRSTLPAKRQKREKGSTRVFDFHKYEQKYVAFKFAYLGWHYNGLVTQTEPTPLPTVEEEIFQALLKSRLIESPETCNFSRCGRTDKGVSAMGQVMALNIRSAHLKQSVSDDTESGNDSTNHTGAVVKKEVQELSWVDLLNGSLPPSIRILAYSDTIKPDFSARFSCRKRHYKYLISPRVPGSPALDIESMRQACSYLMGEHDFRNFCKLDASKQITNFKRTILRCEINPHDSTINSTPELGNGRTMASLPLGLFVLDLEGTAFLWHQVRCIVAVLLLVGQGLEKPEIVKRLLDIEATPRKPSYEMADDWPLTLFDCDFGDEVEWKYSSLSQRIFEGAFTTFHEQRIKDAVGGFLVEASIAGLHCVESRNQRIAATIAGHMNGQARPYDDTMEVGELVKPGINVGNGRIRVSKTYVPLLKRPTSDAVESVNAAWLSKRTEKKEANLETSIT